MSCYCPCYCHQGFLKFVASYLEATGLATTSATRAGTRGHGEGARGHGDGWWGGGIRRGGTGTEAEAAETGM